MKRTITSGKSNVENPQKIIHSKIKNMRIRVIPSIEDRVWEKAQIQRQLRKAKKEVESLQEQLRWTCNQIQKLEKKKNAKGKNISR
jgi:predicted RNase H-like nuclease (RuvC/YqgF family)